MRLTIPVVSSVVDAFAGIMRGADDSTTVARWYTTAARTLRAHLCHKHSGNLEISTVLATGELLAAMEAQRERRRRNRDQMAESQRRRRSTRTPSEVGLLSREEVWRIGARAEHATVTLTVPFESVLRDVA